MISNLETCKIIDPFWEPWYFQREEASSYIKKLQYLLADIEKYMSLDLHVQEIITYKFLMEIVITEALCETEEIDMASEIIEYICTRGLERCHIPDSIPKLEWKLYNLYKGFDYIHRLPKDTMITEDLIIELNSILMGSQTTYRDIQVKPAGSSDDTLYAQPASIPFRLKSLCETTNQYRMTHTTLQERICLSAWFLVEFLRIHPFINGNGRTARLLMYLIIKEQSVIPCGLCIGSSLKRNRERYLKALEIFDRKKEASDMCTLAIHSLLWSSATINDICH